MFAAFENTAASKEEHCYSWMYSELLAKFHCKGSVAHVAAAGQQLQLLEIGYDRGDSLFLWQTMFPSAKIHCIGIVQMMHPAQRGGYSR